MFEELKETDTKNTDTINNDADVTEINNKFDELTKSIESLSAALIEYIDIIKKQKSDIMCLVSIIDRLVK